MSQPEASKKTVGAAAPEKKFKDLSLFQKSAFVGKAAVFLITFGIAFPNIFSD